ncbi:MAG: sulfite exporter TauE/SafE family protein [bacterium]|nr:sulfite exporter TauE/SafE family protein [bacterium]
MYFETAGIEASPFLVPFVAFCISFFTSMGGVSGAFLLLPFQMSVLGFTSPAVSPTNQVFNIMAIPAGLRRFSREGRMVWPLVAAVIVGTLPGVVLGVFIRVRFLPDPTIFKAFAGCVLAAIGLHMIHGLIRGRRHRGRSADEVEELFRERVQTDKTSLSAQGPPQVSVYRTAFNWIGFELLGHRFSCNAFGICGLGLLVGIVGGTYGIGGGSIMAPFFVSVLGLPVYAVAGAALAGTLATSITSVAFYHAIAPFYPEMTVAPDWKLGCLLGLGGLAGVWLGARCQKHVPANAIKWMLSVVVLVVATRYLSAGLG